MVNIYEKVTKTVLENLSADVDKKLNNGLELWKLSCTINNIRQYKACPKQTFLWIVEYILNKNIYNNHIVVAIEKDNINGLCAKFIIDELIKENIKINQTSTALWCHIRDSDQHSLKVAKTHNGQMDVVKGLWDEILTIHRATLESRLKNVGISL